MPEEIELRSLGRNSNGEIVLNGPYHCSENSRCPDCEKFSYLAYAFLVFLSLLLFSVYILFVCPFEIRHLYGTWQSGDSILTGEVGPILNRTDTSKSCWRGPRCELFIPNIPIMLPNDTIYPNFTNYNGSYADYKTTLQEIIHTILYDQCNVTVVLHTSFGKTYGWNDPFFKTVMYRLITSFLTEGSTMCDLKTAALDIYALHSLFYLHDSGKSCKLRLDKIYDESSGSNYNQECVKQFDCMLCIYPQYISVSFN
ncbi:envelope glycoprotein 48 [Wood mouse herpesvirus]|uniref:Envelope glycoprotein 48 n=1 Tax=Wood mouse herpesvirus TaxID=432370 RepID=D0U1L7_9GAMA|nr:envelope glycoprotein 48 [Wood mouse herpesvirus]ACY41101.1 envelope glycoprotein 48 [Wood mouse herpesvirus]